MFLISPLERIFHIYYLMAATTSLILLSFLGSINVLFLTAGQPSFWGWLGLFFTVMATMRFLALFLALYPKRKLAEAFVTGILLEFLVLLFVFVN